jgi:hypothetical protein
MPSTSPNMIVFLVVALTLATIDGQLDRYRHGDQIIRRGLDREFQSVVVEDTLDEVSSGMGVA